MAELRATPQNRLLGQLANMLRTTEGDIAAPEFLPRGLDVMGLMRQLMLPSAETVEKLSYGDPLFRMPTQSNIPITADREYLAEVLGMVPAVPAASRATTMLSNEAADQLVRAITRNPEATAPQVLEAAGQMLPMSRITTYHGSPSLFREFDPARVGTGEGAQAYGVGAGYTAEARPVAEEYRNFVLADKDAGFPSFWARLKYAESGGDKEKAAANINENIAWLESNRDLVRGVQDVDESIQNYRDALKVLKDIQPNQGYLYKGEIPDEILPKFLDWDKPFSKQTKDVKKAYKEIAAEFKEAGDPRAVLMEGNIKNDGTGSMMYQSFVNRDDIQDELKLQATQILDSKGVRGIRYLDQGSRGEGKGTSNFIPFRPEDYRIQEINDIPIEQYMEQGLL